MPGKNNKITDLIKGLLALNLKKEIEEGAYTALGQITKNRSVIQRRQEYATEIERVLKEARLTLRLTQDVDDDLENKDDFTPEEFIHYYNGVFLGQVHQLKDKLLRLIDRVIIIPEEVSDEKKKDPKEVKVKKLLDKNEKILKQIGIYDLINIWESGDLKVALSKRTQHHHFISTLPLNKDFQKVHMTRIMLSPSSIGMVSSYGKQKLKEIAKESFSNLKKNTLMKMNATLNLLEDNIYLIADKLINYYKIPVIDSEIAEIVNSYTDFLSKEDIKNETSKDKIPQNFSEIVDEFIVFNKKFFGEKIISIYLVGSLARGEFIRGSSDINLILILKDIPTKGSEVYKKFIAPFDVTFIDQKDFWNDEHKKDRFIVWSDGVLLFGSDMKIDSKEFPKPGSFLTHLLNEDHFEKLMVLRQDLEQLKAPTSRQLRVFTLRLIKLVTHFNFGVAMANIPFYSSSREKRVSHINSVFPSETKNKLYEDLYKSSYLNVKDMLMVIDKVLPNERKNFEKICELVKHAKNEQI